MATNLFQISERFRLLFHLLEESEGEVTDPIAQLEAELLADLPVAAEAVCYRINELNSDADRKRAIAKSLTEAARIDEARAERLSATLDRVMTDAGVTECNAGIFKLKFKALPPMVAVTDNIDWSTVPEAFVRTKQEFNKVDYLKAWKSDPSISIDGVSVITGRTSLTGFTIKAKDKE